MDVKKIKRWLKTAIFSSIGLAFIFVGIMAAWGMYYDKFINHPNVVKLLDIDVAVERELTYYHDCDIEIGGDFGDCTGVYLLIASDPSDVTEQLMQKGWQEVEQGTTYSFKAPIPDIIAQLGWYGANWYPEERHLNYNSVIITDKPISILFTGCSIFLFVIMSFTIAWFVICIHEHKTINNSTKLQ